jgi:hypothetical protein
MRKRRPSLVFVGILAIGLIVGGCGGDGGDETATATTTGLETDVSADPGQGSEKIVIRTQVDIPTGEVLGGSFIGDSPFCPGGTFRDRHGNPNPTVPPFGLVDRTYRCPGGTLRMGFTPGVPQGRTQTGPWKIVSGTGVFEGLQGDGQMRTTYEPGSDTKGRETFTGTAIP